MVNSKLYCALLLLSIYFSGYVDNIKQLLLSLKKAEFEKIRKKYEKAVPKPLNTQFNEHRSKSEAIKKHIEKKNAEKTTVAFPTSKTP